MGKGICLPAFLFACCCLLPTDVANLRLLFTIIQSIIQFNARLSRPESQFIQLFMHCAGGTEQVRYSLSFSQLFFTCFFSVYLSSSLRIFFRSVALSLYTSSSSFTGPQMRHKIFLQLRMFFPLFDTVCGCIAVCVCVCLYVLLAANCVTRRIYAFCIRFHHLKLFQFGQQLLCFFILQWWKSMREALRRESSQSFPFIRRFCAVRTRQAR